MRWMARNQHMNDLARPWAHLVLNGIGWAFRCSMLANNGCAGCCSSATLHIRLLCIDWFRWLKKHVRWLCFQHFRHCRWHSDRFPVQPPLLAVALVYRFIFSRRKTSPWVWRDRVTSVCFVCTGHTHTHTRRLGCYFYLSRICARRAPPWH